LDFLKKRELASSIEDRRRWIDPQHPYLSIQQQCELLGVPRSTYYHRPRAGSAENLRLLRRLDELYLDCPFLGSRRMAVTLQVNGKRIPRLSEEADLAGERVRLILNRLAYFAKESKQCT